MPVGARKRLEGLWNHLPCGVALVDDRAKVLVMNTAMEQVLSQRDTFFPLCYGDLASAFGRRSRRKIDDVIERLSGNGHNALFGPYTFKIGSVGFEARRVRAQSDFDPAVSRPHFIVTTQGSIQDSWSAMR
ncbi:hypothetical protein FP2506_04471 [Fulvimarina pelagi HTCC2506]|uniref:PAS domain-containing protein n=3 Tax=Fulvimarina pelagi TaxID=217511 RepID=Q0FZY8_9HYPH|nr:hypothetical protein FP2506_04471 [Fulvimarina pelagi HTCC2506]